jgi:hypothetical protein
VLTNRKPFLLAVSFILLLAVPTHALSCFAPGFLPRFVADQVLTEEEMLREHSKNLAMILADMASDQGVIVLGQFNRNSTTPFLHENLVDGLLAMYWPREEAVQMPNEIAFTYVGAYRFRGQQLNSGLLEPLVVDAINVTLSIHEEYEGVVDDLPETGKVVIGVLQTTGDGGPWYLRTSLCPSYFAIEQDQVNDLLACYQDGDCQQN